MDLRCPVCRAALAPSPGGFRCADCDADYGSVDGLPMLAPTDVSWQHAQQREYFDAEFATFDGYRLEPWRQSFNARIFAALGLSPATAPYLDVGVGGSGGTVIEAARAGVDAVGCDLSVEGVVRAARFAADEGVEERASFVVCAAERLPFGDASFGCASSVAVLEHLEDDDPAVAELARVVRPGGRAWVTVPHAYRYMPPPVWPLYFVHDRRIGHRRHYDEARLRRLFERHGFRHVETQWTGHPVKLAQYALTLIGERTDRDFAHAWWMLERADLRAVRRPLGALQLSAVFERT